MVNIAGCGCQGTSLTLSVAATGTNCAGQTWDICDLSGTGTFAPFTLTWQVVPADLGVGPGAIGMPNAGSFCYVSGPFPFSCPSQGAGSQYWMLWCYGSYYVLANFICYPGFDGFVHSLTNHIVIGSHGNTCSPFYLNNQVDSPTCYVEIRGV